MKQFEFYPNSANNQRGGGEYGDAALSGSSQSGIVGNALRASSGLRQHANSTTVSNASLSSSNSNTVGTNIVSASLINGISGSSHMYERQQSGGGGHVLESNSTGVSGQRIDPSKRITISRSEQERKENPERLNLDRRNLTYCPLLENESQLKLLNFQYNQIQRIENLVHLNNLIFLDLYNNKIKKIEGLNELSALRVLMLGKNQIDKIENLDLLKRLDVLDLHNNRIRTIENISHLKELRVLNLAGNQITLVENLHGLNALTEINLRRNQIQQVRDLDTLPNLQRIFLSNNQLKTFDHIQCIFNMNSLMELSLDGNALTNHHYYRQYMLQKLKTLRHLDLKRITEEERRISQVMMKKEEQKMGLTSSQSGGLSQQAGGAASNSQTVKSLSALSSETHHHHLTNASDQEAAGDSDSVSPHNSTGFASEKSFVEVDGTSMLVCGSPSIDNEKNCFAIESITFKSVDFHYICDVYLPKLRAKFPNLNAITLQNNSLIKLNDLDHLASLNKRIHSLSIEQNPVCSLSTLLRSYALTLFPSLTIFDGEAITAEHRLRAKDTFSNRGIIVNSYKSHDVQGYEEVSEAAHKYVDSVLYHAFTIDSKMKCIDQEWDTIISNLVDETMKQLSEQRKVEDLEYSDITH